MNEVSLTMKHYPKCIFNEHSIHIAPVPYMFNFRVKWTCTLMLCLSFSSKVLKFNGHCLSGCSVKGKAVRKHVLGMSLTSFLTSWLLSQFFYQPDFFKFVCFFAYERSKNDPHIPLKSYCLPLSLHPFDTLPSCCYPNILPMLSLLFAIPPLSSCLSHHPHAIHVVPSVFGMDPSFPNVVPIVPRIMSIVLLLFLDMWPSSPAILCNVSTIPSNCRHAPEHGWDIPEPNMPFSQI